MNENEITIQKFFQFFRDKNVEAMLDCYHQDIEFSDPVFGKLQGIAVRGMWKMLLERSPDLIIESYNIRADENKGSAEWKATYTFSKTNRVIVNKVNSKFTFLDGKIIAQKDKFSMWKWAGMALGLGGYILGFTSVIKNQVRSDALNGLKIYMKRKKVT
ncbi:MAG: nuclear transport factor 2 family protein [Leptospiraceae bacterium]|nr:nuclear transport factor 2 family protein [Leptospiraceae bacterium]